MSEAWINFGILLLVQFLIFFVFAFYTKRTRTIPTVLLKGFLIGIPFGLAFDLILGKFLGLSSYALGFGFLFLLPNAALSYGLFAATILLLKKELLPFNLSVLLITALYEVLNIFLNVWTWHFPIFPVLVPLILAIGYLAGAFLVLKMQETLERLFHIK